MSHLSVEADFEKQGSTIGPWALRARLRNWEGRASIDNHDF
jgi:hypothetical protein